MKVKLENKDGQIENLPGLSVEEGSCIFPFNFKDQEYKECYKGKKGDWCATKLSSKTKKMKRWAYCDPAKEAPKTKKKIRIFNPEELPDKLKVPKKAQIVPPYYVLQNKKGFVNWFDTMYKDYRVKKTEFKKSERFSFFNHQKIIRDYMSLQSPYRGLLLYHGLGVGKTCGSIAIAEGFRSERKIIVLLNKSLRENFVDNLKKCGFDYFRVNQHWFYHKFESKDDDMRSYAKSLSMPLKRDAEGAWFIDFSKKPNYTELNSSEQEQVDEQIEEMINKKYTFYNMDGLNEKRLAKMVKDRVFDDAILVVDEVHNITNAMAKEKPGVRAKYLEELIMEADNLKCVFLSGTPMINNLFETAKLFNLLRGKIAQYNIKFPGEVNWARVEDTLRYHEAVDQVIIRKKDNMVSVTRIPQNFVKDADNNVIGDPENNGETDKEFTQVLIDLLPRTKSVDLEYYTALPNNEENFMEIFFNGAKMGVENTELYKSRILGLVSFYKTQNKDLIPTVTENSVVEVPMSQYMFDKYSIVRKNEIEKDRKKKGTKKKAEDPFKVKSSFRAYSRMHCSFVFPETIDRPTPSMAREEAMESDLYDDESGLADKGEVDKIYEREKQKALRALEKEADKYLLLDDKEKLLKYAPKYNMIINKINSIKGLSFVYTEYKTLEGIAVLSLCLKANGYTEFRLEKDETGEFQLPKDFDPKVPRFAVWASSDEQSELIRKIYNNEFDGLPRKLRQTLEKMELTNLRGDVIKALLTTKTGAEGIDLKNVRQVHIMEPYWNPVRLDQVKGRAVRVNSHIELPKKDRTVEIYTYISVMDPKMRKKDAIIDRDQYSSDERLYQISESKRSVMNMFLRMIKEASVDCSLNFKDTNDAEDPFMCVNYGAASTKDYSFVPDVMEQTRDKDRFRKIKQVSWKPIVVNVPGRGKFALKPAPPTDPQMLYDLESIVETGRPGEPIGEILTDSKGKKRVKLFAKGQIKVI